MADTKISDLTAASALTGTEEFPLSDGTATTKAATASQIKTFANTAPFIAAGSAAAGSWPILDDGVLLTTPEHGALEHSVDALHFTPSVTSGRALVPSCHVLYLNADYTGTAGTGSQAIFPAATDRISLEASTTYFFELFMSVTNGATTATKALDFSGGTATFTAFRYWAMAQNAALNTTGTAQSTAHVDTPNSTVILATGTTSWWIYAKGGFTVNAAGTFFPRFAFSANPTGTVLVKRGSYMTITPVGGTSDIALGAWA